MLSNMLRDEIVREKVAEETEMKQRLSALDDILADVEAGKLELQLFTIAQIVEERNAIERKMRHSWAALCARYGYNKREFRNMVAGYYCDDDGIALDKTGHKMETVPGEMLRSKPEALVPYPAKMPIRATTLDGKKIIIGYITLGDIAAVKEIIGNFEAGTGDCIADFYNMLSYIGLGLEKLNLPESMDEIEELWGQIGASVFKVMRNKKGRNPFSGQMYHTNMR